MFHFPTFPPHALCVQARVTGFRVLPGFPIRKSSDHSSVDSSPRHIAASHVLLRLLVPRHPPCALNNLATKMLASTVQFSRYGRPHTHHPGPPPPGGRYQERMVPIRDQAPQPPTGNREANVTEASFRSLRTQQRASSHPPSPRDVPLPPTAGRTSLDQPGQRPQSQRSTSTSTMPA
jgi:hypothetical protein